MVFQVTIFANECVATVTQLIHMMCPLLCDKCLDSTLWLLSFEIKGQIALIVWNGHTYHLLLNIITVKIMKVKFVRSVPDHGNLWHTSEVKGNMSNNLNYI